MDNGSSGSSMSQQTGAGGSGGYLRDVNLQLASNPNLSGDYTARITPITFNNVGFGAVFIVGVVILAIVVAFVFTMRKTS